MDVTVWQLLTKWLFLSVGMFVFHHKCIISVLFNICWENLWVWCVLGPILGWSLSSFACYVGGCHFSFVWVLHIWHNTLVYLINYSYSIISKGKGYNLNSAWEALSTKQNKPYIRENQSILFWDKNRHASMFHWLCFYYMSKTHIVTFLL